MSKFIAANISCFIFSLLPLGAAMAEVVPAEVRELEPGALLKKHVVVVGGGGAVSSGELDERVVYRNTLGHVVIGYPANYLVADDITMAAPDGCALTRLRFQVMGNVDGSVNEDRPYTVSYAFYRTCPEAFPHNPSPSRLMAGTNGSVALEAGVDGGPLDIGDVVEIEVDLSSRGALGLTSMWLAISFDRDNCGVIGGQPASKGFSGDSISFPSVGCLPNLGGYPSFPHASFNVELFGATDSCPCRHLGYRNARDDGYLLTAGEGVVLVDGVDLAGGRCFLTGYEVAVAGSAWYDFELRRECAGDPPDEEWFPDGTSAAIPGTYEKRIISIRSNGTRKSRVLVDPPQLISGRVFLAAKVGNDDGKILFTGSVPQVGGSGSSIQQLDAEGECVSSNYIQAEMQLVLICAGCGDADNDGDSDLHDLAGLLRCYRSDDLAVLPFGCGPSEVSAVDLLVGLGEFSDFLGGFGGPE